ncbi:MAG: glycosyltransferase [Alphaproteobacteria bacterium]|nr:glycosyltransferase [Alphaproteobacteria bacterium]
MARPPDVAVLLSTRDAGDHLERQLDSLARQRDVKVRLVTRDDGSRDGTRDTLASWGERLDIALREASPPDRPMGIAESYLTLLDDDDAAAADYTAFADQDDVWKSDKLARAVARLGLEDPSVPALYCSRLEIVDDGLKAMGLSPVLSRPPAFANALVENVATGCTIVMNRAARDLVAGRPRSGALIHDWWCYLAVSAFGTVIWDPEPTVLYRQHGGNAVGASAGPAGRLWRKVRNQLSGGSGDRLLRQARAFRAAYGDDLPDTRRDLLDRTLAARESVAGRLGLAFAREPWRQSPLDDLAYRLLLVLGRL